jgi:hypothetical protein
MKTTAALVGAVLLFATAAAEADPPATWSVTYGLHATPTDPNSPIVYTFEIELSRTATQGNRIGWSVVTITIRQYTESGQLVQTWTDTDPLPNDELWWTTHADPDDPEMSEFVLPPYMTGTASSADPAVCVMEYELEGVPYTPPPDLPAPYAITAALDYTLRLAGETAPVRTGEEEPVETDPPVGA